MYFHKSFRRQEFPDSVVKSAMKLEKHLQGADKFNYFMYLVTDSSHICTGE